MSNDLTAWSRRYVATKALFFGSRFRITTPEGQLRFFVRQKRFRLREEITAFADEGQSRPMLRIKARSIMDVSATYDVTDAQTGERVGALRRQGLKSLVRDEWDVLDALDQPALKIQEDSMGLALLRRFLGGVIPQSFHLTSPAGDVGTIRQRFNPFQLVYDVAFDGARGADLDPRLGVALVVLLLAIEGRQK